MIALNLSGGTASSVQVTGAPAHGAATVSGTSILYTPTAGYVGSDTLQYTATNAAGVSSAAQVNITVNPQVPAAGAVSSTYGKASGLPPEAHSRAALDQRSSSASLYPSGSSSIAVSSLA